MRKLLLLITIFFYSLVAQAAITSLAPPNGTVGAAYNFQLTSNSTPSSFFNWVVTGLPPGMGVSQQGVNFAFLQGTPTTAGTYTVTVTTYDGNGPIMDGPVDYTITIGGAASIPTMSEWGLLIMAALLGLGAVYTIRRHQV